MGDLEGHHWWLDQQPHLREELYSRPEKKMRVMPSSPCWAMLEPVAYLCQG